MDIIGCVTGMIWAWKNAAVEKRFQGAVRAKWRNDLQKRRTIFLKKCDSQIEDVIIH